MSDMLKTAIREIERLSAINAELLALLGGMLEVYSDTPISVFHHAINAAIAKAKP